jgi:hypothetical protein
LATTKARLENIFNDFPIKIDMLRRTNQENDVVGFATVDLMSTFRTAPYMYVCPVTLQTFRTVREYRVHAQELSEKYTNQEIDRAPARDPEIVYASDCFLRMEDDLPPASSMTVTPRTKPAVSMAKLRVVTVIEDKGEISRENALRVKPGYKMHGGGVYPKPIMEEAMVQTTPRKPTPTRLPPTPAPVPAPVPMPPVDNSELRKELIEQELTKARLDWELWREKQEREWRDRLLEKENEIKLKAKQEAQALLESKMDDLKRSQQEVGRMEVRLKASMDAIEKQKMKLQQQEEILEGKVAAKLQELQLLTKRMKSEAKALVDGERQKNIVANAQISQLHDYNATLEKKIKNLEQEYMDLKDSQRKFSETLLREELATVRAQLAEARESIEREKNVTAAAVLEKEHYRAQMHRLANALKREREKTNALARQEIEQLRLEFLAREERYQLDGDRDALNNIKSELAALRVFHTRQGQQLANHTAPSSSAVPFGSDESKWSPPRETGSGQKPSINDEAYSLVSVTPPPPPPPTEPSILYSDQFQRLPRHVQEETEALLRSGLYNESDTLIQTIFAIHK